MRKSAAYCKKIIKKIFNEEILRFMNKTEIRKFLIQHGFEKIGKGVFADVYAHNKYPNAVIKVSQIYSYNFSKERVTDVFPDYATAIFNKQIKSKYYPKIYFADWLNNDIHISIIKRYQNISYKNSDVPKETRKKAYKFSSSISSAKKHITEPISTQNQSKEIQRDINKNFPKIFDAVKRAYDFIGYGYIDIHSKNIMYCEKTKSVIITDPFIY